MSQFPLVDENVEDGDETTADAGWGEKPAVAQNCCVSRRLEEGEGACCFQSCSIQLHEGWCY